jgi:hypothetical protein
MACLIAEYILNSLLGGSMIDMLNYEGVYSCHQIFPEILKASPYITTNPEEADYFYADAWIFWPHALNPIDEIVAAIK